MTRILIALVALLASVATASAQRRERVDLASLNMGYELQLPTTIDTDANKDTQEWLLQPVDQPWLLRIVAERNGRLCMSEWFSVADSENAEWSLTTRYGRSVLLRLVGQAMDTVWLETPACQ